LKRNTSSLKSGEGGNKARPLTRKKRLPRKGTGFKRLKKHPEARQTQVKGLAVKTRAGRKENARLS